MKERKNKISGLTILLIVIAVLTFMNAYGYKMISAKNLWDYLIFVFIFLAWMSWKIDKLDVETKNG